MSQISYAGPPPSTAARVLPWLALVAALVAGLVLAAVYGGEVVPVFPGGPQ